MKQNKLHDQASHDVDLVELSDRHQQLLSRYFDGECSWFGRMSAERLVRSNKSAQLFLNGLKDIRGFMQAPDDALGRDMEIGKVDLWDKIAKRIEVEERTAVYLGNRAPIAQTSERHWFGLHGLQAALGGLSGAAITAAALLILKPVGVNEAGLPTISVPAGSARVALNGGQNGFNQVSLDNNPELGGFSGGDSRLRPRMLGATNRSPIEVDWVRGNGPMKLIQNPEERTTIIWVRRRQNQIRDARSSNSVQTLSRARPSQSPSDEVGNTNTSTANSR